MSDESLKQWTNILLVTFSDRLLLIWDIGQVTRRIIFFFISVMNLNLVIIIIDRLFVSLAFFNDFKFYILNCYGGWCHLNFCCCKNVKQIWNRFEKSKKVRRNFISILLCIYRYSLFCYKSEKLSTSFDSFTKM